MLPAVGQTDHDFIFVSRHTRYVRFRPQDGELHRSAPFLFIAPCPCPGRSLNGSAETWPSGRRRSPAKGVGGKPSRGFESLRLRQKPQLKQSDMPDLASRGGVPVLLQHPRTSQELAGLWARNWQNGFCSITPLRVSRDFACGKGQPPARQSGYPAPTRPDTARRGLAGQRTSGASRKLEQVIFDPRGYSGPVRWKAGVYSKTTSQISPPTCPVQAPARSQRH